MVASCCWGVTYLLLQGVTISSNGWTDAGHSVNQIYDLLYMMGRDDIPVGVGGEGGILEDGTILPNVGGYLPIVEQGIGTVGYCRYRQAVPVGLGGRLDIDTNFGFRKSFLPQGRRRYSPLRQPTAQRVLIDTISAGPTTVFITGAHTNLAIFLMSNPHLKKNVEHIYVMGGGVTSQNPTGCCPKNDTSCQPRQCGDRGNLFTDYTSNPFAEFNVFIDPFAAYQVIHSGVPITLVPLDATNTIPITAEFFENFENSQHTYEAQYIFKSLKMARDTWFDDQFYTSYFMWDSFLSGVATSIMSKPQNHEGENDFAEMNYMNITVITSNEPYGVSDGSNPLFDGRKTPKFNLKSEVHSGHIQTGLRDPFCLLKNGKGKCRDGYTTVVEGPEGVPVLVAVRAKPNRDVRSPLDREFFINFLDVINRPQQTGRFNFTTEYPNYKEVLYKPDLRGKQKLGKNVVFDMDMSAGDFLALFYLLKLPVEVINLKAILVSPTGWANAATIDVIYDVLHMMGRNDIPVGLGDVFPVNITDPVMPGVVGDCKYQKVIPHGNGGFIDSDTLYGLARDLPRSPRRYTAENSVKFGAPRDTDHPELRQPLALQVWESVVKSLDPKSKITILTNGPLTNVANIIGAGENVSSAIQEVVVVGGHIKSDSSHKGNVINFPSNKFAELNMFFDPVAAKTVFGSKLDVTLIPLATQRKVSSFPKIIQALAQKKTPEAAFAKRLLSRLYHLQMKHHRYQHTGTFVGEILGSVVVAGDVSTLKPTFGIKKIEVSATGVESEDGEMMIDEKQGKAVKVLENVDPLAYYHLYGHMVGNWNQSAVVGSFLEQTRMWSTPLNTKRHYML
nr:Pyrimidine-specific ribonucleoside hydrolase [Ipomoea batatas]